MLPGPVFNVELITTARRPRYYAARLGYGLILLLLVWINYMEPSSASGQGLGGELTIQQMARFADAMFTTFAVAQCLMVLALTPTLVAGVIVDEKQRKTLHYLLSSPLTSGEIVLGKLAARLLNLGVFLALGLPIMSLLSLFGGVDPAMVTASYAGLTSTAFFLAGLSILVSTTARKVREAIAVVYILELGWLVLPPLVDAFSQVNWPRLYPLIQSVNGWILDTNPFIITSRLSSRGTGTGMTPVLWMVGLQLAYGSLFVLYSVVRLRPIFQDQEGGRGRVGGALKRLGDWRWRLLPRPACGDDPMLWKERYVSRTSGMVKLMVMIVAVALGSFLAYGIYWFGSEAVAELLAYGYGANSGGGTDRRRTEFNVFLRVVGTVTFVLWTLGLAGTAACGLTVEREADTWISLVSTPLSGAEILRAKMIGAVWTLRGLGALLLLLWTIGLLSGSIHPLGFLAAGIELIAFSWFAVALGTYVSMRSKTTMRAQATTIGILILLNGGYLLCCVPFRPDTPFIFLGCMPFIEAMSLLSFEDVRSLFDWTAPLFRRAMYRDAGEIFAACLFGLIGYGAGAFGLTLAALDGFDKAVDRPRFHSEMWIEDQFAASMKKERVAQSDEEEFA
jgi:ABC-type transport system involved in multi-copper enzyme maturation permease subunit